MLQVVRCGCGFAQTAGVSDTEEFKRQKKGYLGVPNIAPVSYNSSFQHFLRRASLCSRQHSLFLLSWVPKLPIIFCFD